MATPRKPISRSTSSRASSARRSASQSVAHRTGGKGKSGGRGGNAGSTDRDSSGRFKADHHIRNAAFGATALVGAVAAGVAAAFKFGLLDRFLPATEGHGAEDLLIDANDGRRPGPDHRAPAAFRPDMDAPMTAGERAALAPAPGLMTDETELAGG